MKKILLAAFACTMTVAMNAQSKADSVLKSNEDTHNFGKIKQGTPVTTYFELTNTSNAPLTVVNTYGSCGCTTPDKITEPILPGKTTKLKVQYNAAAVGPFTKDVTIQLAGFDIGKVVHITGEVLTQENNTPAPNPTPQPVKNLNQVSTNTKVTPTLTPVTRN
jgi:hypothetical protein